MAANSKEITVTVGVSASTVEIGGTIVEVSADGSRVVAYTSDVETRAAAGGATSSEGTQIRVSEGFNGIVLHGVTVEQAGDGQLVITAPGTVFMKIAANDDKAKVGDRVQDGTIYAGVSPETRKPMYTTPKDAPLTYTFDEAQKYATKLDAHCHSDWRLPSKAELKLLWENRDKGALKGTFDVISLGFSGRYWSSTAANFSAWAQRLSDGHQASTDQTYYYSLVRCVRG